MFTFIPPLPSLTYTTTFKKGGNYMRMHPRRHGAYNFSARAASAFTNAYFRNKKTNTNKNSYTDYSTSIVASVIIGFVVLIFVIASAIN